MDKSNLPGTFKGSVDDLLEHCVNLDVKENDCGKLLEKQQREIEFEIVFLIKYSVNYIH